MGKIDIVTKEYMKNPVIFADAFNQFLYHGEQKIDPACLSELDTTEIVIPYGDDGVGVPEQKYRDVLKLLSAMTDGKTTYCVMGIENQTKIHYALPVKNGVYDFLQLSHQVSEAIKSHKQAVKEKKSVERRAKQAKPTDGEFLSGFWKSDRLLPVITLVIYFGSESWDAPLSLKEMYAEVDGVILAHAPDYHVNLIAPREMPDEKIDEFQSNLREVMLYIKYSKEKTKLDEIIENDSKFQSMERQAAELINVVTGSKLKYPDGKGSVNMCLAIQQMREESELRGELKGEVKGAILMCKDLGVSLADTIKRIEEKFQLSEKESCDTVKQYW
ncbi:MAG: Rpn family recombination-promoting nuclease/putative transposase [Bacteroidales bacterium]|nr:Rpn family recombination-promoting nuclease/putative transposase [Bacteroidales bacterium]MCM1417093.1 Rpn family recombination-promoting nuclease/putative transposase [bacterium]MCM1424776.1 Rpn family recombination-promoting nuclease/putative transposase [bacterium]